MEIIADWLESFLPAGLDAMASLQLTAVPVIGLLVLGLLGRMLFGHKSALNHAVSSGIGVLAIYAITIAIYSFGAPFEYLLSPLPFISLNGDYLEVFVFADADEYLICTELLSMVILAFLMNVIDSWLPQNKNVIGWYLLRSLGVIAAMGLHLVVGWLFTNFLPQGFVDYAPTVLLCVLVACLFMGLIKIITSLFVASVNPVLGAFYAFFFTTTVGKNLSRAVLTTALLGALVYVLNYLECTTVYIASAVLGVYVPFIIAVLILWYVIGHLL